MSKKEGRPARMCLLICMISIVVAVAGCSVRQGQRGPQGEPGVQGEKGEPGASVTPLFADDVSGCTDPEKVYVLPDGYVYAYMTKTVTTDPVNQIPLSTQADGTPFHNGQGWKTGYRLSGGEETQGTSYEVTGFIPVKSTDTFRIKKYGFTATLEVYDNIYFYDSSFTQVGAFTNKSSFNPLSQFIKEDGTIEGCIDGAATTNFSDTAKKSIAYMRLSFYHIDSATVLTVNQSLESTTETVTGWMNTGHAFVPADYENRIVALEETVGRLEEQLTDATASLGANTCSVFRKVVCCGDSYTAGYIDLGDGATRTNEDYAWPAFMARLTGGEYVNCGDSGATVLDWPTRQRGLPKAQAAGQAQAYLVGLGINDSAKVDLGTAADIGTDSQTYYGGLSGIVRELNAISPMAKIFLQTMPTDDETRQAYNQAVRDVVTAYKDTYPVHLLDLDAYRWLYLTDAVTDDRINGHYTAIGYQQFAENLRYVWSRYMNDNIDQFQDVYLLPYD